MDLEEQYEKIYRYCYFKVHKQEMAEDITQETFLKFYERFGHYGNEWTLQYLYKIAYHLCVDEYRRPVMEQIPDEISEESYEEEVVTRIVIKGALSVLSDKEKEILLLRYANEVPISVICKIFHISRFTLYRMIKGAIKKLRIKLEKEGYFEI